MKRVLITGASGYIGQQLAQHLHKMPELFVMGADIKRPELPPQYLQVELDVRDQGLQAVIEEHGITHVVHLASIVNPGQDEALEYDIDVNGTKNVIHACKGAGVEHLTITSSGAAYGYHADNPQWLTESHPLRGNDAFSYSRHKRLVEEMLAQFAESQDRTRVLILRPCTVLGKGTRNRITQLFERKRVLAVGESDSPFVFIWDQDVVGALSHGVLNDKAGAFNLAGDGKLDVEALASIMNKPIQRLSPRLLKGLLWLGNRLGLTQAGPEQVRFLQFRPVLCNHNLKTVFGFTPQKSSKEAFEVYWQGKQNP